MARICTYCGGKIDGGYQGLYYCSAKCQRKAINELRRRKKERLKCPLCGLLPLGKNHGFCERCRPAKN